jgi:hypothetical protein
LLCFFAPQNIGWLCFSVSLITEIPEIVKFVAPVLRSIPLLGRVIPLFQAGEFNEAKTLEQLQAQADKNKNTRQKLKDDTNKRVIKVRDALECVEKVCFDGRILIRIGKALLATIAGRSENLGDIMFGEIADCMLSKALQQDNRRRKGKFTSEKGLPETYTELISLRRGRLHPFLPESEK